LNLILLVAALAFAAPRAVHAEASLVVEADTGKVAAGGQCDDALVSGIRDQDHDRLRRAEGRQGRRLTLESMLTVSPVAASQSPSKWVSGPACRSPSKTRWQ